MENENKHISLWSSKHSDQNELAKMTFVNDMDVNDKAKIRAAFSATYSDERVSTYTPDTNAPVFARIFG